MRAPRRETWYAKCTPSRARLPTVAPDREDAMTTEIEHQEHAERFVASSDGLRSFLRYRRAGGDTLDLLSTFVHRDIRGRGVGEALVKAALDYARDGGMAVIPTCWFVDTVIDRNPEYRDLLAS